MTHEIKGRIALVVLAGIVGFICGVGTGEHFGKAEQKRWDEGQIIAHPVVKEESLREKCHDLGALMTNDGQCNLVHDFAPAHIPPCRRGEYMSYSVERDEFTCQPAPTPQPRKGGKRHTNACMKGYVPLIGFPGSCVRDGEPFIGTNSQPKEKP